VTNSWSKYDRSVVPTVPLAAWVANSRIRDSKLPIDAAAPSATWVKLIPSLAFRAAWLMLRIWARNVSDTPKPAASSAARVIRNPDDNRSTERANALWFVVRFR
jgi:hypothetical protein